VKVFFTAAGAENRRGSAERKRWLSTLLCDTSAFCGACGGESLSQEVS